ncbi:MAG: SET domain-containing protein-lysine N-methyltransferase [Myxococcota bacterium]
MARIPGLKVVRSPVQGYGVITTRFRRKGSVIADVDGVLWREGEDRDDRYSLILEPGVFFDMVDQTRWVNHSCEPNVVVEAGLTRAGHGWAQLQALRDIEAGEELFYDYALPVELKEPCFCRTKSCRGWIVEASATGTVIAPARWREPLVAARATPRRPRLRLA